MEKNLTWKSVDDTQSLWTVPLKIALVYWNNFYIRWNDFIFIRHYHVAKEDLVFTKWFRISFQKEMCG